jgi:hypothetical protein
MPRFVDRETGVGRPMKPSRMAELLPIARSGTVQTARPRCRLGRSIPPITIGVVASINFIRSGASPDRMVLSTVSLFPPGAKRELSIGENYLHKWPEACYSPSYSSRSGGGAIPSRPRRRSSSVIRSNEAELVSAAAINSRLGACGTSSVSGSSTSTCFCSE